MAKLKNEHEHWLIDGTTLLQNSQNLEGSDINETIKLVNKAEEVERARRMSIPFSADVEETELDISVQSGQLSNVHQELLHLFAIHDVSYDVNMFCSLSFLPNERKVSQSVSQSVNQLVSQSASQSAICPSVCPSVCPCLSHKLTNY